MSRSVKHSQQNNQSETEIRKDAKLHPEDCDSSDAQAKDLLKTSQTEKRSVSPLTLLKEEIKEGVLKVFKDKDTNPKTTQPSEKPINPLTLLKEDLNNFKDDISSTFRNILSKDREDKDVAAEEDSSNTFKIKAPKTETTDRPLMGLFRRDQTLSKINQQTKDAQEVGKTPSVKTEEPTDNEFRNKNSISAEETNNNVTDRLNESDDSRQDGNVSQEETEKLSCVSQEPPEKPINPLTLLKEDLNHFKDDISSAFRNILSKDREDKDVAAKEDSSNTFKIKAPKTETTDRPLMGLFRRAQTLSKINQQTKDAQEVGKTPSVKTEEPTDNEFRNQNSISADETNNNVTDRLNESDDSRQDGNVSQEETERRKTFSETQQKQEVICASETADQVSVNGNGGVDSSVASGEEEDEDKPSETVECPLSSTFTLFSVGNTNNCDLRELPGGYLWALKNFACYLTLDPSTANAELHLTENSRTATRIWPGIQSSLGHPERFENCPQVLCREGLLDKVYWEVEWNGGADIGVSYNNISRDGDVENCLLGHNEWSWTLECSEGSYTPCHNRKRFKSSSPEPFTRRVGVYLNWSAGTLSFYCVSEDNMVHLHTFTSTFTEPLYPGFWVWACDGSVSLRHVELEWERALR